MTQETRTAIVTGAARGIGAAVAARAGRDGAYWVVDVAARLAELIDLPVAADPATTTRS
nr:hypothetical protein [Nocardia cyriacigeorgica]